LTPPPWLPTRSSGAYWPRWRGSSNRITPEFSDGYGLFSLPRPGGACIIHCRESAPGCSGGESPWHPEQIHDVSFAVRFTYPIPPPGGRFSVDRGLSVSSLSRDDATAFRSYRGGMAASTGPLRIPQRGRRRMLEFTAVRRRSRVS
jgi:hypothetical protein